MLSHTDKHKISADLEQYCKSKGSQSKAANTLNGVSSATVSQIVNHKWDMINDSMWNRVASQIGSTNDDWEFALTADAKKLYAVFSDAKQHSLTMSVVGKAGAGKTSTTRNYVNDNKNVFHIHCNEYWDRRWFLRELLKSMGKNPAGMVMPEMMEEVVLTLKTLEKPQIIFDEADKLKDQVLYFFITLYNRLEEDCSMILMATDYLKKRVTRGLNLSKKGYREIYSRIGKRFIELQGVSLNDVVVVCAANGVTDQKVIKNIFDDCDSDLRRVKRLVHAYKRAVANG